MPGTDFNSSGLVRLLAELRVVANAGARHFPAERLGRWIDVADAITLHAAQSIGAAISPQGRPGLTAGCGVAVAEEFARVRATLAESIAASCSPASSGTQVRLPRPRAGEDPEVAAAYGPYRRFHVAHQAAMEPVVRALRDRVRRAVAGASARLRQLAALDQALDRILAGRERQLLATLPALLEKRFQELLAAHEQAQIDTGQADDAGLWMQPGGWLAAFCDELQAVLIAELDLRLQPTLGLVEALQHEVARH